MPSMQVEIIFRFFFLPYYLFSFFAIKFTFAVFSLDIQTQERPKHFTAKTKKYFRLFFFF